MPDTFWQATPRTILAAIKGYWRRRAWTVWHAEYLRRADRMPDLDQMSGLPRRIDDNPARLLASLSEWKAEARARKEALHV